MFSNVTKVVKNLFYANLIAFALTLLSTQVGAGEWFENSFALFNFTSSNLFQPWQLITYMFLHSGIIHILFNMLAFLSLAPYVESSLGSRKFLIYYIISGILGALLFMLTSNSGNIPIVGASGAIWGVATMFAYLFPNEKLFFFLIPVGVKAKYFISFLFIVELLLGIYSPNARIAHMCHVGGGLSGILLMLTNQYLPKSINKYL